MESDELWRLGIVLDISELKSDFLDLRSRPMRLLVWFTPPHVEPQTDSSALAMCKLSLFDTFDNVHEYQARKGVQLRAANTTNCCYPHVTLASYMAMPDKETVLMNLDTDSLSLDRNTGLSRPTTPTIIVASSSFLSSHGYNHMELVWIQPSCIPLPLERVVISDSGEGNIHLTPSIIDSVMEQLVSLVESDTVLFRQDTVFSLPGTFTLPDTLPSRHGTIELTVLECLPVLQGQLTSDTEVVVVAYDKKENEDKNDGGEEREDEREIEMSSSLSQSISTTTDSCNFDSSLETKSRSASVISNCSASDFRNEDDLNSDPSLELLTHPLIKLHRNYIIVPKQFAMDHELYQYQMVILEGIKGCGQGAGLRDMVLCTRPHSEECNQSEGNHAAILMWYEGQSELEPYLPPPYPGYHYDNTALQCAYVHPHLLYSLFSETLSPSRRYYISVKVSPVSSTHLL